MPPKKPATQGPNKKTVEKKREKVIEDKTFGMKNKKGKKQQTFIKHVTNQVKFGGGQRRETADFLAKKDKEDRLKEREFDSIFRPVQQKISSDADPKSVLCLFFKQGQCTKGDKCKFSHDLSLEGKSEKRSMYVDARDGLELDTIDTWDEAKLQEVVNKKHAAKPKTKTDIVCKHFLLAIEKAVYGWFWECPVGSMCIYRHALPPGFVFKKALKEQEDLQAEDAITMEELVENEREQLGSSGKTLNRVTLETFIQWKKTKVHDKVSKRSKHESSRKEAFKAGRTHGISGREMFTFNPSMVAMDDDDDEEGGVFIIPESDEEEEGGANGGVDLSDLDAVSRLATQAPPTTADKQEVETNQSDVEHLPSADVQVDEDLFLDDQDVTVDESLFLDDPSVTVDESLFDVDNLQDLDLNDPAILQPPT